MKSVMGHQNAAIPNLNLPGPNLSDYIFEPISISGFLKFYGQYSPNY